jgi:hypothetical protein
MYALLHDSAPRQTPSTHTMHVQALASAPPSCPPLTSLASGASGVEGSCSVSMPISSVSLGVALPAPEPLRPPATATPPRASKPALASPAAGADAGAAGGAASSAGGTALAAASSSAASASPSRARLLGGPASPEARGSMPRRCMASEAGSGPLPRGLGPKTGVPTLLRTPSCGGPGEGGEGGLGTPTGSKCTGTMHATGKRLLRLLAWRWQHGRMAVVEPAAQPLCALGALARTGHTERSSESGLHAATPKTHSAAGPPLAALTGGVRSRDSPEPAEPVLLALLGGLPASSS